MRDRSQARVPRTLLIASVALFLGVGRSEAADAYKPLPSVDREVQTTGRVTGLDRNTGVTTLEVQGGKKLVFQFSPQSVADLNAGDRIVARATFSPGPSPQLNAPAPAGDAPAASDDSAIRMRQLEAAMGQHSVSGTVENLNRATGQFDVQTKTVLLRLEMRPETVKDLKPGQEVTVDMGFAKETP